MSKRTRSLSNAVCFKHDNNVCACAVSALILLPVVNLSLQMNSVTSISYISFAVRVRRCFHLYWRFFTAHTQFRPYHYFRFKIWHHIWLQRTHFPVNSRSFRSHNSIFGDFCDDNVCACAVSALILLPVVNFSLKMDSTTLISYKTRTFRM